MQSPTLERPGVGVRSGQVGFEERQATCELLDDWGARFILFLSTGNGVAICPPYTHTHVCTHGRTHRDAPAHPTPPPGGLCMYELWKPV